MFQDNVKTSEVRNEDVVGVTKNISNLVYHFELKPWCQFPFIFNVNNLIVGGSLGAAILSVRVRLMFAGYE